MALRVWLPLNGSVENKGISNITVTNNGATVNDNGKIGKCYYFNGSNSNYLKIDNPFLSNSVNHFSVAFWVKIPSNASGNSQVVHIGNGGGWNNNRFTCFIRGGTSSLVFSCGDGVDGSDSHSTKYNCQSTALTLNQWTHVICIYDNGLMKIYLNGILNKEYTTSIIPSFANVSYIGIGAAPNTNEPATVYVNDVRIYDHCLSAKEVKEISQGLVLHYKLDGWSGGSGENLAYGTNTADVSTNVWRLSNQAGGTTNSIEYDGNTPVAVITRDDVAQSGWTFLHYDNIHPADIKTSTTYTISFDVMASVDGTIGISALMQGNATNSKSKSVTNIQSICTANTWSHIVLQTVTKDDFTDINNNQVIYLNTSSSLRAANVTIKMKNMKMEIGTKDTSWSPALTEIGVDTTKIIDSSGYENDGTITGALSTESDSNRYEISTHYSGSSYTDTGSGTFNWFDFSQCTLSAWIKPTASVSSWSGSIGVQHNQNAGHKGFSITDYANNFRVVTVNGSYTIIDSGKPLTVGEWHHCAAVLNGTNLKMYYDGAMVKESTVSWGSAAIATDMRFATGVDFPGGDEMFTGNYSDVRMYCTALSAEDILDLYHTSASVDNLQNIHAFELKDNENTSQILKNGIIAIEEFHESNSELLNNFSSGGYAPAKDTNNSCVDMGTADFTNYADLNKDLSIHIECDIEWTAFTAGTGGTFKGIWWQGSNYKKETSAWAWVGANYVCSILNSTKSLQNVTTVASPGKYHYDVTTTIPASWFNTYSKSYIGFRCDYSDGTGRIDVTNFKITPSQYYNAKIGKDFISANNFIEK